MVKRLSLHQVTSQEEPRLAAVSGEIRNKEEYLNSACSLRVKQTCKPRRESDTISRKGWKVRTHKILAKARATIRALSTTPHTDFLPTDTPKVQRASYVLENKLCCLFIDHEDWEYQEDTRDAREDGCVHDAQVLHATYSKTRIQDRVGITVGPYRTGA
jgi:hypothetical protein